MEERIYSVTEFNSMVKEYLEESYLMKNFFLKGELSGVTYYKSGHLYFTLKDKKCQIKCAAFNYKYKRIQEDLKEGDSVKIFGDVGFYENRGDFQILVRHIEKEDKLGELYIELEKLKEEYSKKGYFSQLFKKRLPRYPKNIGVVTALTGAAFHDIVHTTRKRFPNINIYLYPAKVQGLGAEKEIAKGIETLDKIEELDLIIAGRGGGSIEDLWAFNKREVIESFYKCKKPIISAVGHEIDTLLSDLVADERAATPTQAAEIAIPVKEEILENLNKKRVYLEKLIEITFNNKRKDLEKRENNYIIKSYSNEILKKRDLLNEKDNRLKREILDLIKDKKHELSLRGEKIVNMNPLKILSRGYSITYKEENIIKETKEIKKDDIIKTYLHKGIIISKVEEIKDSE